MSHSIRRTGLFVASCAGMSAFGFALVLLGTLLGFPEVRTRLEVDSLTKQGGLSSVLILGMFVSTSIVGPLIDRFGNKVVLSVSAFLLSIAFICFAVVNSFPLAVFSAVLLGIAGGGLNTSTNVVVSELYPENRGAMLNVLAIFFGTGAVTVPLLAARVSPTTAILVAAFYATIVGMVYLLMSFPDAKDAHCFSLREAVKVVGYPGVLLFSSLLFFQSANEQVTHTFASRWVGAAGASPRTATLALVGYMAAMAGGRIIAVRLLKIIRKEILVMCCAGIALSGTVLMFLSASPVLISLGILVTALGFSAIFPTVLAIAGDRYQRFAGTVFGTLFAISLIGAFASPSIAGFVGQKTGIHMGTVVPLCGAVMVVLLTSVVVRQRHSADEKTGQPLTNSAAGK